MSNLDVGGCRLDVGKPEYSRVTESLSCKGFEGVDVGGCRCFQHFGEKNRKKHTRFFDYTPVMMFFENYNREVGFFLHPPTPD